MKSGSLIIGGFIAVGLWYLVGYLQGLESAQDEAYHAGYKAGLSDRTERTSTVGEA